MASVVILAAATANAVETGAPRALMVESDSGSVLFAKGADKAFAPGNFAKLVTAAVVFDALGSGEIREDTAFPVSEHAWRTGGAPARVTTMFAKLKSDVPVDDLLHGLVVQYANDAAIILAEGLEGSEDAFARRMNEFALEIGMADSRFANPTGYADVRSRTTVGDLRTLIDYIRTRHPLRYGLFAQPQFEWNKIVQRNKTTYVHEIAGVEGLMLAYDEADGFGAAVSQVKDGRRILVIASGFTGERDRDNAIKAMLEAAYSEFTRVLLFPEGARVGSVRVFGGETTRVPVTGDGPIAVTLPRGERDEFRLAVVYDGPVPAPIGRGDQIAFLEVRDGTRVYQSVPLVAATDVAVGDTSARARDGLAELLFGWW